MNFPFVCPFDFEIMLFIDHHKRISVQGHMNGKHHTEWLFVCFIFQLVHLGHSSQRQHLEAKALVCPAQTNTIPPGQAAPP